MQIHDKGKAVVPREAWDYKESVAKAKGLVSTLKIRTLELVRELHIAREKMSCHGFRTDKNRIADASNADFGTFVPKLQPLTEPHTWEQYCNDIGLEKRTANRWLLLYVPEEDRMLTPEEYKEKVFNEWNALIAQLNPKFPNWRPAGWNAQVEAYYQKQLKIKALNELAAQPVQSPQPLLFDTSFYTDAGGIFSEPTQQDILHFHDLKVSAEKGRYTAPGQKTTDQVRTLYFIERLLKLYGTDDRRDVAKAIADMILNVLIPSDDFYL